MDADLFTARDTAALLLIRKSLDEGRLSGAALGAAFAAAGLMREAQGSAAPARAAHVDARTDGDARRAA